VVRILTVRTLTSYHRDMSSFTVRSASPDDLDVILDIWRAGIESSLGGPPPDTIDYRAYFAARIEEQTDVFRFFLIQEEGGKVVAWQSILPFRSNPATRGTMGEISVYTHPDWYTSGATHFGMSAMWAHADASPLLFLMAVIAEGNKPARALADRFEMQLLGLMPKSPKAETMPALAVYLYPCKAAPHSGSSRTVVSTSA
jgi:L-amino acid N-acyltransferase YncA